MILSASLRSYQPRNDANNKHTSTMQAATNGFTPSCEEIKSAQLSTFELSKNPLFINLAGMRFGMLVVVESNGTKKYGSAEWRCICDCGKSATVLGANLRAGRSKSCGCAKAAHLIKRCKTHGESKTSREYRIWCGMRVRCHNKNAVAYKDYGGRGIKICDRWGKYEAFLEDMGRCPSAKHSIDRVNPNGDYEPNNCRWATASEQGASRRTSRIYEFEGKRHCIAEWERITGAPIHSLWRRLKLGWDFEKALTTPYGSGQHGSNAKLLPADVLSIRKEYASGKASQKQLASKFAVTQAQISMIVLGRCWQHVK
jgi:hypothetical protein